MDASVSLGAAGEHNSLKVLWEDTERVFCKLPMTPRAIGTLSHPSLPVPSIRRSRALIASHTNTN